MMLIDKQVRSDTRPGVDLTKLNRFVELQVDKFTSERVTKLFGQQPNS